MVRFPKAILILLICTFGWLDPAFGSSALDKAYISKVKPSKGILIHLHGCSGLHVKGWLKEWIKHLEKSGYKVFAPDSFVEKRPPAQCGTSYSQKGEVRRIRNQQFKDVYAPIRKSYPKSSSCCKVQKEKTRNCLSTLSPPCGFDLHPVTRKPSAVALTKVDVISRLK